MAKNQKEYNKARYLITKDIRKEEIKQRQKDIKSKIQEYKLSIGCNICGYNKYAPVLQFHHIGNDKEHNISKMTSQGRSLESIFEEIKKCICVCANCHVELHEKERINASMV